MYGPSNSIGVLLLNGRESTGQDISEVMRRSNVTCGGTRVRSISDHMGGSRLGTRALHSRPDRIWAWRLPLCLWERGCVIPWRRPSWVRIPPPAPTALSADAIQRILDHAFYLRKEGYRESTIVGRAKALRSLARKTDILNPEAVKETIARRGVTEARKENLVCVYALFCKQNAIPFAPPRYQRVEKLPFVPLESEVDQLIATMGKKHATYLKGLNELGCRAGEL